MESGTGREREILAIKAAWEIAGNMSFRLYRALFTR